MHYLPAGVPMWPTRRALADLSADIARLPEGHRDPLLHAAVDALLLAHRLPCARLWTVPALVWLAYRVGRVVGRRR